jgi:hypothetical protein
MRQVTADAPVFVVGFQRSGTTLLQALVGAHRRIASPPEMYYIFRVAYLADYFGDLNDDHNLRRVVHETLHPSVPLLEGCGFDENALFERVAAGERSYAAVLDAVMMDFAVRHGKARWCEKTPGQHAREVFNLMPHAQVLHIVRDPRAVVASSLQTPWTKKTARQLAHEWRVFTRDNVAVGADVGPRQVFQLRYEDLTADPASAMRDVCGFLGEEFDDAMLNDPSRRQATIAAAAAPWQSRALEPVTASRQDRWRRDLSSSKQAQVAAITAAELQRFDYDVPPARVLALGRRVNAARRILPSEWWPAVERRRVRRAARTPEGRYAETQRFMARASAHVEPRSTAGSGARCGS